MDITLFAVRAFSTSMYKSEIDNLYQQHAVLAYKLAKESSFWHSRGIRELPVADEAQGRKALGLVLLGASDVQIANELHRVFVEKLGVITQKFINQTETKAYYVAHKVKLSKQVDALPQRVIDYILLLLDGNGTNKLEVAKYAQKLLNHWTLEHHFFEVLPDDQKDEAMTMLVSFFPKKRFTTYFELQKMLQEQDMPSSQLEAFQYFYTSEYIATEEYAYEVNISKRELRDLFAVAVFKKISVDVLPFYVLSGIESLIVAKSFNRIRSKLFTNDLELLATQERIAERAEQAWYSEKKALIQENNFMQQQLDDFGHRHRELEQQIQKEMRVRDDVIAALERQLESKQEELQKIHKGVDASEEVAFDNDLSNYRIAVVGGYTSLNQTLEKMGMTSFLTVDRLSKALVHFDYVFLITAYTSHKVKMKLDNLKIDYYYVASDTKKTIFEEIQRLIATDENKR
ncbi:hypothetical protein HB999_14840 [Listeria booriae]|uniref:hypothetical protein n=1 Tax=Listeria booriae TaxID=1552123 RepID=UPI00164DD132|nr:hypothetical protein [Listeria booriae]MBC6164721.1 hypothetical protein [Listeria booriae]